MNINTLSSVLINARQELWLAESVVPPPYEKCSAQASCQGLWNHVLRPWLVRMVKLLSADKDGWLNAKSLKARDAQWLATTCWVSLLVLSSLIWVTCTYIRLPQMGKGWKGAIKEPDTERATLQRLLPGQLLLSDCWGCWMVESFVKPLSRDTDDWLNTKNWRAATPRDQEVGARVSALSVRGLRCDVNCKVWTSYCPHMRRHRVIYATDFNTY